jgi:hypothetical protein
MVAQLSTEIIEEAASEIWVTEIGLLSASGFDFENRKYAGKVYRLNPESLKSLVEAIGFTLRYDAPAIRSAYFDISKAGLTVSVEMARNTKPADVALRYAADRWAVATPTAKGNDALRPWHKTTYRARALSDQAALAVSDAARIDFKDRDKFFIRFNFKDGLYGLITEEENLGKFPSGAYSTFQLPLCKGNVVKAESESEENDEMAQPERLRASSEFSGGGNGSSQAAHRELVAPKYAIYSRSEVDQLLKQQYDQLTAAIATKSSAQRKELQEALKTQEKSLAKIADDLHIYCETVKKQIEVIQNQKQLEISASVETARSELLLQIEQFKTHLNKNVLPSVRNLDERVRNIITASNGPSLKEEPSQSSSVFTILAAVALLISLVNFALFFLRH